MNTGAFGEGFPYSNFHELNMDWIIKIAKDFLDQYSHIQETIQTGLDDLDAKATELEGLLQDWYDTHSEDIANQLADALEDLNAWYTEHEGYLDQYVQDSITAFNTAAGEKAAETIATIPDDYTALFNNVHNIKNYTASNHNKLITAMSGNGFSDVIPITVYDGGRRSLSITDPPNVDDITISSQVIENIWGSAPLTLTFPEGYKGLIVTYNASGNYSGYRPGAGYTSGTWTQTITYPYVAIEIRKEDDSALTASNFDTSGLIISAGNISNIPMTTAGKALEIATEAHEMAYDNLATKAEKADLKDIWGYYLRK